MKDSLIADFTEVTDREKASELGFEVPFWSVEWDFVLAPKTAGT
ncbi:hypothetical protein [Mesorhizobium australafricanum]|uniref:Uncharacterized protein n=1 Tax=Mesorhizobium australafricanum TaxID=3072311 RepID=A0ABU4WZ48_9HYPH|nr:hypothetical protein [Mesorhizobium sp. VK3E]MDX8441328.1 hypothetical protein [Mesorhizobium sp. VK3E]